MMCSDFAKQKRRKDVRQMNLPGALKITAGEVKILRHYAEVYILCAKHVPRLPECFLHPEVGSGVPVSVVPGKE